MTPEDIDAMVDRALRDAAKNYIGKTLDHISEWLCGDMVEAIEIPPPNYRVRVDVDPDTLCPTVTLYPASVEICASLTAEPDAAP